MREYRGFDGLAVRTTSTSRSHCTFPWKNRSESYQIRSGSGFYPNLEETFPRGRSSLSGNPGGSAFCGRPKQPRLLLPESAPLTNTKSGSRCQCGTVAQSRVDFTTKLSSSSP